MKIIYGVQGPAEKVSALSLPRGSRVVRLSYDVPITSVVEGEISIFAPKTTWGSGRNAIMALIRSLHPDADYLVMLDHDVAFRRGSFEAFEAALADTRPAVAFPLMPKAQASATLLSHLPVQRAMALDEQMVALHRSVLDTPGLCPLITTYDWASWYVSSYIFEYTCSLKLGPAVHQYNEIHVTNDDHAWIDGENTAYLRGDPTLFHHLVNDALGALYGVFNPLHVEQLDTPDEQRCRDRYAKAAIITTFDGRPISH